MAKRRRYIPGDDQELADWTNNHRRKALEHYITLGLSRTITVNLPANSTQNILTGDFTDLMPVILEVTSVPGGGPPPQPPSSLYFQMTTGPDTPVDLATAIEVVPGTTQTRTILELGGDDKRFLNVTNPSPTVPGTCKVTLPSEEMQQTYDSLVQELLPALSDVLIKKADLAQAVEHKEAKLTQIISQKLRPFIKFKIKGSSAYTPALGDDMKVIGSEISIDPAAARPELKESKVPQGWRFGFNLQNFFDGVNIYRKRPAEPAFIKLAFDSSSPYIDTDPQQNGTQYYAFYVISDVETGQQSDIITIKV